MLKLLWKSLLVSPAIIGAALAATSAQAVPATSGNGTNSSSQILNQVDTYANEGQANTADQVTSVSELRDVKPTAWTY